MPINKDALSRMPRLARALVIFLSPRVDDVFDWTNNRSLRFCHPLIAGRLGMLQCLAHRLPRMAQPLRGLPLAQALHQHHPPYSFVLLHGYHLLALRFPWDNPK